MSRKKSNNFVYYFCQYKGYTRVKGKGRRRIQQDNICKSPKLNQVSWFILTLEKEFACSKWSLIPDWQKPSQTKPLP